MSKYILPSAFVDPSGKALTPAEEIGALLALATEQLRREAAKEQQQASRQAQRYALGGAALVLGIAAALTLLARSMGWENWLPWIAFGTVLTLGQALIFYRYRQWRVSGETAVSRAAVTKLHRLYWPVDLFSLDGERGIMSDPSSQSAASLTVVTVPEGEEAVDDLAGMEQMLRVLLSHERAVMGARPIETGWHPIDPVPALQSELVRLWRTVEPDRAERRSTLSSERRLSWDSLVEQATALRNFFRIRDHLSSRVRTLNRRTHDLVDQTSQLLVARQRQVQAEMNGQRQERFAMPTGTSLALSPGSPLPLALPTGARVVQQAVSETMAQLGTIESGSSERLEQLERQEAAALASVEREIGRRRAALAEKKERLTAITEETQKLLDSMAEQGTLLMAAAERLEESSRNLSGGPFATLNEDLERLTATLQKSVEALPDWELSPQLARLLPAMVQMRDAASEATESWQELLYELGHQRREVVQQGMVAEQQANMLLASGAVHPSAQVAIDTNREEMEWAAERLDTWLSQARAPMAEMEQRVSLLTRYLSDLESHERTIASTRAVFAQLAGLGSPEAISLQDVSAATMATLEQALKDSKRYQQAANTLRDEARRGHHQRTQVTTLLGEWAQLQEEWLASEAALDEDAQRAMQQVRDEWQEKRAAVDVPQRRFEPIRSHVEVRLSQPPETVGQVGLIQDEQTLGWLDRMVTTLERLLEDWGARLSADGPDHPARISEIGRAAEAQIAYLEAQAMPLPLGEDEGAVRCLLPFYRVESSISVGKRPSQTVLIPPAALRAGEDYASEIDELRFPVLSDRLKQFVEAREVDQLPSDADANLSQSLLTTALTRELERVEGRDPQLARILRNTSDILLDEQESAKGTPKR